MGPNDKDDEHLGSQRLYEPARMKEYLTGMKNSQHHEKSEKIEDGTDRADCQHELAHEAYVPLPGVDQVFLIDVVQWNRNFNRNCRNSIRFFAGCSTLGPKRARRAAASLRDKPVEVELRCSSSAATFCCQKANSLLEGDVTIRLKRMLFAFRCLFYQCLADDIPLYLICPFIYL